MAKIVYGLSGDGSGHSSRTREMASHLVARGHEVKLVSYERGYRNLKDEFDVFETEGLLVASKDNRVARVKTFTSNLKRLTKGHKKLRKLRKQLFKQFQPDVVITDFEPMTAHLARRYELPLITIDNQHRMRYGVNCTEVRRELIGDFFYRLPELAERLSQFSCGGNRDIKAKLDELLDDNCKLTHEFRRRRRAKQQKARREQESVA